MKLTVYRNANTIAGQRDRLANLIKSETRFGMGCSFQQRREHVVMDPAWLATSARSALQPSPATSMLRDGLSARPGFAAW